MSFSISFIKRIIKDNADLLESVMPDSYNIVLDMIEHYNQHDTKVSSLDMEEGDYMEACGNEQECNWALEMMQDVVSELVDCIEHNKKHPIL